MTDKEILDLIDHYRWSVVVENDMFIVQSSKIKTNPRNTVREAVYEAVNRQIEWATKPK